MDRFERRVDACAEEGVERFCERLEHLHCCSGLRAPRRPADQRMRDGFLEQDGAACLGGGDGDIQVESRWVGDDDRLGLVLSQRLAKVRLHWIARKVRVRQRGAVRAEQDDIGLSESDEIALIPPVAGG